MEETLRHGPIRCRFTFRFRSRRSRRARRPARRFWLLAALLLVTPTRAVAQDVADPPGRAARLAESTGRVWLFASDANEWLEVGRNRPLAAGDRIATDSDAYAEIALGTTVLRAAPATELEIAVLDDRVFSVVLHGGSVAARLKSPEAAAGFSLITDEGRFVARTTGHYRFDRFERTSDVTVLAGQATFENRGNALAVNAGQRAQFWLDGRGAPQYAMAEVSRDAFARWAEDRDRVDLRLASSTASRYVSPEMVGWEDLDRHGRWEETGEYGAIWTPRAVPDRWAPYSHGHWAWVSPWGWTWVDDAPWGYAPFHYGRWVWYRERWGWAPGRYVQRPVYAPALVAWFGGPGLSIGIGVGGGRGYGGPSVGWVPLAPREVYVPPFRTSAIYVRNLNSSHVADGDLVARAVFDRRRGEDRRDFANRKFPHGVTVVPASVIERRERVDTIAARFRNDPAVLDFARDPRPVGAIAAPPVERPRFAPLPRDVRAGIRPPFEGRAPGFVGRIDGGARPADRDGDGRVDRFERPDRGGDRIDRGDRPDRIDRIERTDRPERIDRIERGDRPDRVERVERADRPDRIDRIERTERPDRGERIGIPRGFPRSDEARRGVEGPLGAPAGRIGPPETHVGPPESRVGAPETRVGPPDTRFGPPDTRIGAPDRGRVGPPDGTRVGPPDGTRVGPPDGTRVGPPAGRFDSPEPRPMPGETGRAGSPPMRGAPPEARQPEPRVAPPPRVEAQPQPMQPPPRLEAPRAAPPPPPPQRPVEPPRAPEVQRPAAPPAQRDAPPPRAEERRGPGGGPRERER
jgi:hypothetical protein